MPSELKGKQNKNHKATGVNESENQGPSPIVHNSETPKALTTEPFVHNSFGGKAWGEAPHTLHFSTSSQMDEGKTREKAQIRSASKPAAWPCHSHCEVRSRPHLGWAEQGAVWAATRCIAVIKPPAPWAGPALLFRAWPAQLSLPT